MFFSQIYKTILKKNVSSPIILTADERPTDCEPIFAAICGDALPAVLPTEKNAVFTEKDAVFEEAFSMQTFARSHFVTTVKNMREFRP